VRPVLDPVCPRPGPGRRRPGPAGPSPAAAARGGAGQALTAHQQALAGLRDELAGPAANAILAAPGQHASHAAAAARITRAVIAWDSGQVGDALELLRDAVRHGTGTSPDARHVQPLLALAAALVDLRQLGEAEGIVRAADHPALGHIPSQAGRSLLHARIHLACGRLADAATAARTAQALTDAHPGFPALAAAAVHSQGLACRDPARLAEAAALHPDPWARASAAEDLGVLHGRRSDRDQAIHHLKEALGGYRQGGADRDQARIRRRLRQLGIRSRHWSTTPAGTQSQVQQERS